MAVLNNEKTVHLYKGNGIGCDIYKGSTRISGFDYINTDIDGIVSVPLTSRDKITELIINGKSEFANGTVVSLTSPEVTVTGKNLLNIEKLSDFSNWTMGNVYAYFPLRLPPGTYIFSCEYVTEKPNIYFQLKGNTEYNIAGNGTFLKKRTFRITKGENMRIMWNQSRMNQTTLDELLTDFIVNMQIEYSREKTDYSPIRQRNTLQYENTVLRSVPLSDGDEICDTLNVITGKLTRRISPLIDNCTTAVTDKTEYVLSTPEISYLTPHELFGTMFQTSVYIYTPQSLSVTGNVKLKAET